MTANVKEYPRVLVVTADPISRQTGLGVTMSNLFQGWPKDKIAQVVAYPGRPDPDMCDNFWQVSSSDVPLDSMFRSLFQKMMSKKIVVQQNFPQAKSEEDNHFDRPTNEDGIIPSSKRKAQIHGILRAYADIIPYNNSKEFWNWISDFKPDLIYGHAGSSRYAHLLLSISNHFNKPIFSHIMDDWISTMYANSLFTFIPRRLLLRRFRMVIRSSQRNGAISEQMADEYTTRFGRPFIPILNAVTVSDEFPGYPVRDSKKPFRFVYVGGLHLNRWRSLRAFALALRKLHQQGIYSELVIHAPMSDLDSFRNDLSVEPITNLSGSILPHQMNKVVDRSDAVLHVEAFDKSSREYARLSLSTKIPQYLSRGRPLVVVAPDELASYQHIANAKAGLLIDSSRSKEMEKKIIRFIEDDQLRLQYAQNAWQAARKKHNVNMSNERFRKALLSASVR